MRVRDVREGRQERLVVHVDLVHEGVADDLLLRRVRRQQDALEHLQGDVDDVVAEATAVREAGDVAADDPEAVRRGRGGDRHVEAQVLRRRGVRAHRVEVERVEVDVGRALRGTAGAGAGGVVARDAGEERRDQVGTARAGLGAVRVRHAVDALDELGDLRVGDLAEELRVAVGRGAVEEVLQLRRHDGLVDERVAQARDLDVAAALVRGVAAVGRRRGRARVGAEQLPVLQPRGRRPDADDRVRADVAPGGQLGLGHLQRDAVDVVAAQGVGTPLGQVAAVQQVEDAQVEEERVVGLPDVALAPEGAADRLLAERGVVRDGGLADVARRDGRPGEQAARRQARAQDREVVGLPEQQVLVGQARDRAVVVEEGAVDRAALLRAAPVDVLERVAEHQVGARVAVVVDVDVVRRAGVPREEVRAAGRLRERRPVGDEGDRVGLVRADERVGVGVVHRGVALDVRGLAVARRRAGAGRQERRAAGDGDGRRDGGGHPLSAGRAGRSGHVSPREW